VEAVAIAETESEEEDLISTATATAAAVIDVIGDEDMETSEESAATRTNGCRSHDECESKGKTKEQEMCVMESRSVYICCNSCVCDGGFGISSISAHFQIRIVPAII